MKGKIIKLSILAAVILICLCGVLIYLRFPESRRADYQVIASQEYDTVFLSMYPTDNYRKEDYAHYRAMNIFIASYCIPDISTIKQYMARIEKSGNTIATAYLGIRPDKTSLRRLQALLELYPSVTFEVILACPSIDYWQHLPEKKYERLLSAYREFLTAAPAAANANYYFMGTQEWLVSNPANYESDWHTTEDGSRCIMLYSDLKHQYVVTKDNAPAIAEELAALTADARNNPKIYPDLSDHCLIFWGDSVIANYTDSTSIPNVVVGLTNARVFNLGYGGNSASRASSDPDLIFLPGIVDAFFAGDISLLPEGIKDMPVYTGFADYLENPPTDKTMCYIINYGLNDYFRGHPVSSEDPYDITTYSGALKTAVTTIRANDPDAQIILCTPTFIALYERGTQPHGVNGNILTDYVQAVLDLSSELQVDVLDNYNDLNINADNFIQYLYDDLVHPNDAFRYILGERIADIVQ